MNLADVHAQGDASGLSMPHVPDWLSGETLYGWASRFQHLRGGTARQVGQLLFGREHACRQVDFPTGVGRFVAATDGKLGSVEQVLRERTVLGAYWPFCGDDVRRLLVGSAGDEVSSALVTILGLPASRFGAQHALRYCVDCARGMVESVGYATWSLEHQLPGVWVCERHLRPLHHVARPRAIWHRPGTGSELPAPVSDREMGALLRCARLARSLPSMERADESALRQNCIDRLRALSIASSPARLNNARMDRWFASSPIGAWLTRVQPIEPAKRAHWTTQLLRARARSQPMKWLVLWAAAWDESSDAEAIEGFVNTCAGRVGIAGSVQGVLWPSGLKVCEATWPPAEVCAAFEAATTFAGVTQRLSCSMNAAKQWLHDYPALAQAWTDRVKQQQHDKVVGRLRHFIAMTPEVKRGSIWSRCRPEIEWLRRNVPATLNALLSSVPTTHSAGPQLQLFQHID
jgi:hypothetical protein